MQKTPENYHKQMTALMFSSFLVLIVCVVVLGGLTYAWFTDVEESEEQSFTVDNPQVSALALHLEIPEPEEDAEEEDFLAALQPEECILEEEADPLDGNFRLSPNTIYVMQFTYEISEGAYQPETCFLLIQIGEEKYYTEPICPGESIQVPVAASDQERTLRYTTVAGNSEAQILGNDFTLLSSVEEEDAVDAGQQLLMTAEKEINTRLEEIESRTKVNTAGTTKETAAETTKETAAKTAEAIAEKGSEESLEAVAEENSEGISEMVTEESLEGTSEAVSEESSEETSEANQDVTAEASENETVAENPSEEVNTSKAGNED